MAEDKIRIVTHNGGFHADDIFAVSTLLLFLGKNKDEVNIIRTRDPEIFATADYLVDVGAVHDPALNKFDHHQAGGAGERENGIPYAAFGLVWNEFGEKLVGSYEGAEKIERRLVQAIDAEDVGFVAWHPTVKDFHPYTMQSVVNAFVPGPEASQEETDDAFVELLDLAMNILRNEIRESKWQVEIEKKIVEEYQRSNDKSVIVLEESRGWGRSFVGEVLARFPEPVYFVRQHRTGVWQVVAVEKERFVSRKPFPSDWRGKRDEELQQVTGSSDAVFCHPSGFMCIAQTKEGAEQLAKITLNN